MEKKPIRQKTDSVTHLVKIVAKEVFNEEIESYKKSISNCFKDFNERIDILEQQNSKEPKKEQIAENFIKQLIEQYCPDYEINRKGYPWSDDDEGILHKEFYNFCSGIGKILGRTPGAIKIRINQKIYKNKE